MKCGLLAFVLIVGSAGAACAAGGFSEQDRNFLVHDAQGSSYELALSEMAREKASDPQVREFAQEDIADHTTLNKMADTIAQRNGLSLSTTVPLTKKAELARLQGLTGPEFDRAYLKAMKSINADDKEDFRSEAKETSDPQMKQFVERAQAADAKHENVVKSLSSSERK